jgi:hypothetical protein
MAEHVPPADGKEKGTSYKAIESAIFLGIVSAIIGYAVSLIDEHRKNQVKIVDMQIEKLYGPLYALSVANRQAWEKLHQKYRQGKTYYFNDEDKPSTEQVEIWRRWVKTIFLPINIKMENAIIENAQLLEGGRIYPSFVKLIMHIESYKATVAKWKETDDLQDPRLRTAEENTAVIEYPTKLDICIQDRLDVVLTRREDLRESWIGLFVSEPTHKFSPDCS